MFQKLELQQLHELSLEDIKSYKRQALEQKAKLEAAKVKGGKDWYPALQEELDEVALILVDVDDVIEEKVAKSKSNEYVPEKGTEKMVHLSIVQGRRFNPNTGKEVSKPYIQKFTFAEWQLFKNNFVGLGYTIMKVLHDPYNDAEKYVVKK